MWHGNVSVKTEIGISRCTLMHRSLSSAISGVSNRQRQRGLQRKNRETGDLCKIQGNESNPDEHVGQNEQFSDDKKKIL